LRTYDEPADVIVVGTGAAGLMAALAAADAGADVAIFEKSDKIGGTTAISGGVTWIPWHSRGDGAAANREDAVRYLASLSHGLMDAEVVERFIDEGASCLDFIEQHTPVRFTLADGFPDYKPEAPGACAEGGRSFNPRSVSLAPLGEWSERILRLPKATSGAGFDVETRDRLRLKTDPDEMADVDAGRSALMGEALIAGLLQALLERGIEPVCDAPVLRLILDEARVVGVEVQLNGATVAVRARRGVVLSTGGFEWDAALARAFLRGPFRGAVSPPENGGDGLRMAMAAGAELSMMREAWWAPVVQVPGDEFRGRTRLRSVRQERTRPGTIMVNSRGRRFTNEAADYNSLGAAFQVVDVNRLDYPNRQAWIVFDQAHLQRYGFLGVRPGQETPEWFHRSDSLDELAGEVGIDAAGLSATVLRWNDFAIDGLDPDFDRGVSRYDSWWGDQTIEEPARRTVGPIGGGPYYAVEIGVGILGTKGGPRIDPCGRVQHIEGGSIPGLYAAGNVASGFMGMLYPGGGGTIGPALVVGRIAGREAARPEATRHEAT
jgi:3-oxosteroid 1-dehydrogenase